MRYVERISSSAIHPQKGQQPVAPTLVGTFDSEGKESRRGRKAGKLDGPLTSKDVQSRSTENLADFGFVLLVFVDLDSEFVANGQHGPVVANGRFEDVYRGGYTFGKILSTLSCVAVYHNPPCEAGR